MLESTEHPARYAAERNLKKSPNSDKKTVLHQNALLQNGELVLASRKVRSSALESRFSHNEVVDNA